MQHLDPKQLPESVGPKPRRRTTSVAGWVAAVAIGAIGIGAGLTYFFPTDSSDHLTQDEVQQRQHEFDAHGPVKVELVPADQVRNAVAQMKLSPTENAALLSRLAPDSPQPLHLARIQLWDSATQDGDVVELSSAGYQRTVSLLNQPVELTVPVDATSTVQITGVRDGGGGITLGVRSGLDATALPVMTPGQILIFPVSF